MSCLFWLAAPSNQKEVGGAWNCADGGWCRQSWAAIAPIKAIIFFNFPSDVLSYHHYYESHIKVNVPRSIFPVASPHITNICSTGVSGHAHRLMPGFLEVKCVCVSVIVTLIHHHEMRQKDYSDCLLFWLAHCALCGAQWGFYRPSAMPKGDFATVQVVQP